VIADPPVAPAVNVNEADDSPPVAVPIVGACGTVVGVIADDDEELEEVPLVLVAVAVNVYSVPTNRPVTVTGLEDPVPTKFPGEDVTVYPVIESPPVALAVIGTDAEFVDELYCAPIVFVGDPIVGA
jgi:hypothetical protein